MTTLLLPLIMVAVMFMLFRSNKKRQDQAKQMQSTLQPGYGVRTIGGMYALVKAVNDETVELEVAPGVVVHYVKNAVAAVLEPLEYDAIINGRPAEDAEDAEDVDVDGGETPAAEAPVDAAEKPAVDPKPEAGKVDAPKPAATDGEARESK